MDTDNTQMLATLKCLRETDHEGRWPIRGHLFPVMQDCTSAYADQSLRVPAGCFIEADFVGDFGMYAIAEIDGVLHKVQIPLDELHKIDFGEFDKRTA